MTTHLESPAVGSGSGIETEVPMPTSPPVKMKKFTTGKVASNIILMFLGVLFVLPLLWLVVASFDEEADRTVKLPKFTLSNFGNAMTPDVTHSLWVSFELSIIAALVATVVATLAAYAFSRRHIPWKGPLLLMVLFLSGVPISVIIVPLFQMFSSLKLLSLLPVAILLGVISLPFEIWMIKNFIDAVPRDLEEAASIEQAGTITILLRVVTPLAAPGIGAAAIFGFVNAWGNFLIPLVLLPNPNDQPGPVIMYSFFGANQIHYGELAAFCLVYSIPVIVLYLILGRVFSGGFVLGGAVK